MASDEPTDAEETPDEPAEAATGVEGSSPGPLTRVYRTVTPPYGPRPDAEMNTIGWMLFIGILFLLFPLLPVLVVVWLLSKLVEALAGR